MNDLDSTDLARDVLTRLAATMPDNPARVTAVQRIVRRRRRRSVATRATLGLASAAGIGFVAVVVATRSTSAPSSTATSGGPAPAPSGPCHEVGAPAVDGSDVHSDSEGRMKATGTITAVDGDTLAVALQAASIDVADLTATLTADTQYRDAGQPTATRPELAVGEAVAFGAIAQPDGSYLVGVLETHSPEPVAPSDPPIAPGVASADSGSKATLNDGWIKANGTISALDGDSVSVDVDEASVDIATASLTLTAATTYVDAGAAVSTRPELAVGDAIAFVGTAQPDGSYLVDHLEHDLLDTPHVTPDADTAAADAAKRAHVLADCTATTPG